MTRTARVKLPDGTEVDGEVLSEVDVADPAVVVEPAATPVLAVSPVTVAPDTVTSLAAAETTARNEHQNQLDAAKALIGAPDRHLWQAAVDVADSRLNAVLSDLFTRRRALTL